MRHSVNPEQQTLFDLDEGRYSAVALRRFNKDWPGLFRTEMLKLMPVKKIGKHFHDYLGRPTKELYSMAGLIFLKEALNLTLEEAVERYIFDARFHYALNVAPVDVEMSKATLCRYQKIFLGDDLSAEIYNDLTAMLIETLEIALDRQRVDSTHICSDMATFGRTRLMGVAIKRFLVALCRHDRTAYDSMDKEYLARYAPAQSKLFADSKGSVKQRSQSVAEDLFFLVERFSENKEITNRNTYKAMVKILNDQCDIELDKVTLKAKTGGDVMQNPSDKDATYDGHKGSGYQVQICETCSSENEEQLIVACIPETACCSDADAIEPTLDQLEEGGRMPKSLSADEGYSSDENVEHAKKRGVDLQSPVAGKLEEDVYEVSIDDFVVNEENEEVELCPAGKKPISSVFNPEDGKTRTTMSSQGCFGCDYQKECPIQNINGEFIITHTAKSRRLASRRREQDTDAFKDFYRLRAGGESVNSGLKRKTGFGRLRRRGMRAVRMSVFLKVAGWNMFRAVSILRKRKIADLRSCFSKNSLCVDVFPQIKVVRVVDFHFGSQLDGSFLIRRKSVA